MAKFQINMVDKVFVFIHLTVPCLMVTHFRKNKAIKAKNNSWFVLMNR